MYLICIVNNIQNMSSKITIPLPKDAYIDFRITIPMNVLVNGVSRSVVPYDLPDECNGKHIEEVIAYIKAHNLQPWDFQLSNPLLEVAPPLTSCAPQPNPRKHVMLVSDSLPKPGIRRMAD